MVRLRFAPSPTGKLHVGGLRTALFSWLYARQRNGKFILRLEDTDQNRIVKDSEKYLIRMLEWSGLTIDESPSDGGEFGPYRQSERLYIYKKYVQQLIEKNLAYRCFCSLERLDNLRALDQKILHNFDSILILAILIIDESKNYEYFFY